MHTAVVSDLHLATRMRRDLLRDEAIRARLLGQLSDSDQVVLLGDAVELRDRPLDAALSVAEPFFEELGAVVRAGRVILVPGNHDHRLLQEAARLRGRDRTSVTLFQTVSPRAPGALGRIRSALGTELVVAYPGVWLADGVWATHGHYLDAHSAAPSLECLAAAALGIARRRPASTASMPEDYEAVLSPAYRLYFAIAQRSRLDRMAHAGKSLVRRAETTLGARPGGRPRRVIALGGGRLGTAPGERRRPGVLPLARVLERLRIEAGHVLFGHTHRTGPLPGDPPALWRTEGGTELWNTGSWVYEAALCGAAGADGAYWPGTVTLVGDGRPRFVRALSQWQPRADGRQVRM